MAQVARKSVFLDDFILGHFFKNTYFTQGTELYGVDIHPLVSPYEGGPGQSF